MLPLRSIGAALVLVSCAAQTVPGAAVGTGGGGTEPAADGGTAQVPAGATLLDQNALAIFAVSADEQHVLVAHTYPPADVELVVPSAPVKTLVSSSTRVSASFSPDGRSIVFTQPDAVSLARSDGSEARVLAVRSSFYTFAGRWFYYVDESNAAIALYRLLPPDGAPQLLVSFEPPQPFASGSLTAAPSPDGESVVYCHWPALGVSDCFLLSPMTATPLRLPAPLQLWSPDGSWALLQNCALIDLSGGLRDICAPEDSFTLMAVAGNGARLATLTTAAWPPTQSTVAIHLYSVRTSTNTLLPTPGPFDGDIYRPSFNLKITPDASRLIAVLGESAFSIPVAGGQWTQIVSDSPPTPHRGLVEFSGDSHIVGAQSAAQGFVVSVDGAPPQTVGPPGAFSRASFEPAGGLGKAIFFGQSDDRAALANADGTGERLELPRVGECNWVERTALCLRWKSGEANQALVLTDDGRQFSVTTHDTSFWPSTAQLTRQRLFYISHEGGLYMVDHPAP